MKRLDTFHHFLRHAAASLVAAIFLVTSPHAGMASELGAFANLLKVATTYESRGWSLHDFEVKAVVEGDHHDFTVQLDRGDRMIVRGEGDGTVRDLDLGVFTPSGRLVKKDVDYDRTPCVEFTAPVSGVFHIRVVMASCQGRSAHFALLLAER